MKLFTILNILIKCFEKAIRLVVPGFYCILLIKSGNNIFASIPLLLSINITNLILLSILIGMAIYSIHRSFFALFDFIFIAMKMKTGFIRSNADSFRQEARCLKKNNPLQTSFYRINASVHLSLMIAEMTFLKYLQKTPILVYSGIIWLFFVVIRVVLINIELEAKLLKKEENRISKEEKP